MTVSSSRIRALTEAGKPLTDVFIIDGLTSVGSWASLTSMLLVMDRLGIDTACLQGNPDRVLAAIGDHPDRFIGTCRVNPNYPDEIVPTLERSFAGGMRMIKLHPAAHSEYYPIDGPNYRPVFEFAVAHQAPILIHSGPRTEVDLRLNRPYVIAKVAQRYPDADFIISHCGAYDAKETWEALDEAVEVTEANANIYLNFNTLGRYYGVLEYLVQNVGAERVIFGSDEPQHAFMAEIGHVAYAKVSDADKEKILGLNMARLLNLRM